MERQILIATVGEQEVPLFEGFKRVKDIDKVYFLASKVTQEHAEKIKKGITKIYDSDIIIINEKDLEKIIYKLIELHKKERQSSFMYNVTGGTKIMSLACHVVASFLGERIFYIFKNEKSMEFVEVPLLKYDLYRIITRNDRKCDILKMLRNQQSMSLTDISNKITLKKPTVLGHLSKLVGHNLVRQEKGKGYCITDTGKIFLDMLEVAESG